MFFRQKPKSDSLLDKAIHLRLDQLQLVDEETDGEKIRNLEKLYLMKEKEEGPKPEKLSPNSILVAFTTLFGIVMMLVFEKDDVITSKAIGFIPRGRFKN